MSQVGHGYGSEWQLLRWMGRHRTEFDRRVLHAVGQPESRVKWLDHGVDPGREWPDIEPKGLSFLPDGDPVRAKWESQWPQSGNVPNWDAVGLIEGKDGYREWLLVEAKAHTGELVSSCGARSHGGLPRIEHFLAEAKIHLGAPSSCDWLTGNYQYANRVATLSFLVRQGLPARLLFLYFTGEHHQGWDCPADAHGWQASLSQVKAHLGLSAGHAIADFIHDLFLPVA